MLDFVPFFTTTFLRTNSSTSSDNSLSSNLRRNRAFNEFDNVCIVRGFAEPRALGKSITASTRSTFSFDVLKMGGRLYHGADAVQIQGLLSSRSGSFNRLNFWLFRWKWLSSMLYPILRSCRNLLLKLMGKTRINNPRFPGHERFWGLVVLMFYSFAATVVLVVHLLFIIFVLAGGLLLLWRRWVALVHLPATIWAVLLELNGWICPLTPLENRYRAAAGQAGFEGGFIEHYLLAVIYPQGLTPEIQQWLGILMLVLNLAIYGWVFLHGRST